MEQTDAQQLKEELAALRKEVTRLRDEADIRKVHHKYGYYIDKCLYKEIVDLWSNHPDAYVEFLGGRYRRKEGIKRLYVDRFSNGFVNGRNGPVQGFLLDHAMMQDIVDINDDGKTAWARIRTLMSAGTHQSLGEIHPRGLRQWWEGGVYENEYIKEDGIWKPFRYRYFPFWHADFQSGWSNTKPNFVPFMSKTHPEDKLGPDELVEQKMMWPDTRVVPFHYPNPVTGKEVEINDLRAPEWGKDVDGSDPPLSIDTAQEKK